MNASTAFGLTEIDRATVDGTEWVLYSDGGTRDAVEADSFDEVEADYLPVEVPEYRTIGDDDNGDAIDKAGEHNAQVYSLWCSATGCAARATLARVLRACDIDSVNSGAHGRVQA